MEEFNPDKIITAWIKEWRICTWAIFIAYAVLGLLSVLVFDSYVMFFLCTVLFYFFMPRIQKKLYNKHLMSILDTELDPEKYLAIMNTPGGRHSHGVFLTIGYRWIGDHQSIINIVANRSCDQQYKQWMPTYLYYLSICYFELDDKYKLRAVCNNFEQIMGRKINKKKYARHKKILDFNKCYLKGELNTCKTIAEELKRTAKCNAQRIYAVFRMAVITYKLGQKEEAKVLFENVCATAPKLGIAKLSQKYIEAINTRNEVVLTEREITPDPDYVYPYPIDTKAKKRVNWSKILIIITFVLALMEVLGFLTSHLLHLLIQ